MTGSTSNLPRTVIRTYDHREQLEAEKGDPYAMGYEAAGTLGSAPDCPFSGGMSARLWRQGFNSRVSEMIAAQLSAKGLSADVGDLMKAKR